MAKLAEQYSDAQSVIFFGSERVIVIYQNSPSQGDKRNINNGLKMGNREPRHYQNDIRSKPIISNMKIDRESRRCYLCHRPKHLAKDGFGDRRSKTALTAGMIQTNRTVDKDNTEMSQGLY